jgi:hypothetical protein
MAWFKIDDNFVTSQKVLRIPRALRPTAIGIWTMVGVWSAHDRTDGVVPSWILEEFGCTDEVRQILVEVGLWHDLDNGIVFKNWSDWQPTKAELEAKSLDISRKRSEAGKRGMASRYQADNKTLTNSNPEPEPEPEPITTNVVISDRFDEFWAVWPRREAKATAKKSWAKALKKATVEEILTGAVRFAQSPNRPELRFVPHASTWLNNERWSDPEPVGDSSRVTNAQRNLDTVAYFESLQRLELEP